MKVKAKVSFSGSVSMACGEIREIKDKAILKDLLDADYIEQVDKEPPVEKAKKATKKAGDAL